MDKTRGMYLNRDVVSGSWWSTWISIYDRKNRELQASFHEGGNWLKFKF